MHNIIPFLRNKQIPVLTSHNFIGKRINTISCYIPKDIFLGFPLVIFQDIFTYLHYGYHITNFENILLQFSLGYSVYGTDRLLDALENKNNTNISPSKLRYYTGLKSNMYGIIGSLIVAYSTSFTILSQSDLTQPFIPYLILTFFYKILKQYFGEYKSLYIGISWTLCTIILPCIIHDNTYDILYYPLDYLPAFLTLFSCSNILDIKDIEEDKENNINTIPVLIGENKTYIFSIFCLLISTIILTANPHYDQTYILNNLYNINNVIIILPLFIKNMRA